VLGVSELIVVSSCVIVVTSIADALVDEVVEGVAAEVGQVCDGCVESLYHSEFLRPP